MSQIPESFQSIRDIFVIHTHEMLKLDRKPPIYGVALLVTVACEVLAKVLPDARDAEEIFAREFAAPRAPQHVGRGIYEVLRNGLAHSYGPHPIIVGNTPVRLALTWKGGPHLRVVGLRREGGHNRIVPIERNELPTCFVCLDAESLHRSLVAFFDRTAQRLLASASLARTVDANARRVQRGDTLKRPQQQARKQWEDFLLNAALHKDDVRHEV